MRSLRAQLLISHLALVVLMAAVTGSAVYSFVTLGRSAGAALQADLQTVRGTARVDGALAQQREVLALLQTGSTEQARTAYLSSLAELAEGTRDIEKSVTEADEIRTTDELEAALGIYGSLFARVYEQGPGGAHDTRTLSRTRILPSIERLRALTERLRSINEASIVDSARQRKADANQAIARTIWVTAIAVLLAVLLAIRQNRTAVEPLLHLTERAETIAAGDFAVRETARTDEIGALGTALEEMAGRLDEARAQSRRRVQRLEQMSDAALEHLYDPVVVLDGKARVVHLNRAAESLFGALPEGEKVPVATQIGDRRLVRTLTEATTRRQAEAPDDETALVPLNGRTYRLRTNPMAGDDGAILGSVAVLEDVTQMREVDRLKNEFIGVASHELRTPVASLLLGAQMLQEGALGELNETQKQVVDMQLDDLGRLSKLMQDLLDVTKLESGSVRTNKTETKVADLVRGPIEGLRSQSEAKKIDLTDVGTEEAGRVLADRGQVGRVLTNLVSNAIRHTPEGGTIRVRALPADDEVTFAVEDSGEGIPEGYLATIFDRFVQVPGATQGGAGLGLSIAGNIVRAHGGRIWAESVLGQGSKFCFTLPRNAATGGDDTL